MAQLPTLRASQARQAGRLQSLRRHAIAIGALIDDLEVEDLAAPVFRPGDVAQLLPTAHPRFGGCLLMVRKVSKSTITGYLLRAHREGWREAWHSYGASELLRVGHAAHADGVFSLVPPGGFV